MPCTLSIDSAGHDHKNTPRDTKFAAPETEKQSHEKESALKRLTTPPYKKKPSLF